VLTLDDRVAEVWASPGRVGAGLVVGQNGILTARHIVASTLDDERATVLARIVRRGQRILQWVPMMVVWESAEWDLALLVVDSSKKPSGSWVPPVSEQPVAVILGAGAQQNCEAVGFPRSAKQVASNQPDKTVRQPEHATGTLLPSGGSKRPVTVDRQLPREWMPFDINTKLPPANAGWSGMSGAPVITADARLAGLVVAADVDPRRLYVVPVATVLAEEPRLGEIATASLASIRIESLSAALFRSALDNRCLGEDGLPLAVRDITDLAVYGVSPSVPVYDATYLPYVARECDDSLHEMLSAAMTDHKMLLVIGASGSGKSRAVARTMTDSLGNYHLLRPYDGPLDSMRELPFDKIRPSVIFLDDVQRYLSDSFSDIMRMILNSGVTVIGTIRRAEWETHIFDTELRGSATAFLKNPGAVVRLDWPLEWSESDKQRLFRQIPYPPLVNAVTGGTPVGVWCIAGPALLDRLEIARHGDDHPVRAAIAQTVLDWYLTGIGVPIPIALAMELVGRALGRPDVDPKSVERALRWLTANVLTGDVEPPISLLTRDATSGSLAIHDYILDHEQQQRTQAPPIPVWDAALVTAGDRIDRRFRVVNEALAFRQMEVAIHALDSLASVGISVAQWRLINLHRDQVNKLSQPSLAEAGDSGSEASDALSYHAAQMKYWEDRYSSGVDKKTASLSDAFAFIDLLNLELTKAREINEINAVLSGDQVAQLDSLNAVLLRVLDYKVIAPSHLREEFGKIRNSIFALTRTVDQSPVGKQFNATLYHAAAVTLNALLDLADATDDERSLLKGLKMIWLSDSFWESLEPSEVEHSAVMGAILILMLPAAPLAHPYIFYTLVRDILPITPRRLARGVLRRLP
jgi:Trypsin-like peptidase domain